jgi:hypothetical protein
VFVSSTLGELAEERQAVSRAISALRLTPVMFEVGARPHPSQDLYREPRLTEVLARITAEARCRWTRPRWSGGRRRLRRWPA